MGLRPASWRIGPRNAAPDCDTAWIGCSGRGRGLAGDGLAGGALVPLGLATAFEVDGQGDHYDQTSPQVDDFGRKVVHDLGIPNLGCGSYS